MLPDTAFQESFYISNWTGIIDSYLIRSYMIASHVSGIKYVDFLERTPSVLLENVLHVFSMMAALPTFHAKCVIG
jgi:hypothetical protein